MPFFLQPPDAFDVILDALLAVDELAPENVSGQMVLDGDDAEFPSPVRGVHQRDDRLGGIEAGRHFQASQRPADGAPRNPQQSGEVGRAEFAALIEPPDFAWRRFPPVEEAALADLATPPLDAVFKPFLDDLGRAAKTAFFFSYGNNAP